MDELIYQKISSTFPKIIANLDHSKPGCMSYSNTILDLLATRIYKIYCEEQPKHYILKRILLIDSIQILSIIELCEDLYIVETKDMYYFTIISCEKHYIHYLLCPFIPVLKEYTCCNKIMFFGNNLELIPFHISNPIQITNFNSLLFVETNNSLYLGLFF